MHPAIRLLHHLTLFLVCCAGTPVYALETVTLQLQGMHSYQYAGYYAAIQQGYYREAGLSVTLKEAQSADYASNEVVTGKAEYGTAGSSLLLQRNAGKPVVVLAVIFQHSPYMLAAQQTQSIHDLHGKKLVLNSQARELLAYLKSEYLPLDNVSLLDNSQDPQDLISGKADAISVSSIYQPYYLDRANFTYQTYQPRAVGIDFYGDNLYTTERELKNHPERVQAFRAASLRGWQFAMQHPEELTNLILASYTQRHPRQFFLYQARQIQSLMHPELIQIGEYNHGRWKHIAETYAEIGLLPENYSLDGFLLSHPRKLNLKAIYWGAAISLSSLLFIAMVIMYIVRLRRKVAHASAAPLPTHNTEVTHGRILELLGNGAPLASILEVIVRGVEQGNPGMRCCISILNNTATHLLTGAAPSLPEEFKQIMNGLEIALGAASSGTAAFTGQRVTVEDTQTHPYWAAYKHLTGKAKLKSCWSEPIYTSSGKILGTVDIYHSDIRKPAESDLLLMAQTAKVAAVALERSRSEQTLRENEKLLSDILENVSACIYMKDRQGRYLFANRLLRELFNAPMEEIVGFDDGKFYDAATAANMRESDLRVMQTGEMLRGDENIPDPLTGQTSVYHITRLPLRHDDGGIYALCGIANDISEQRENEEYMRHMAQYDSLTNMPNRALFNDRLQQTFSTAKRMHEHFGLMFIDLDKFKPINDNYGHAVGDLLLQEAAQRMQNCVRESDTVARVGGDEFVVLLASLTQDHDAHEVAEKIRHALNLPFEISGHTLNISSSIGIALYPAHGDNEKELVKHADLAMYYAKENGRNNVTVFHEGLKDSK